MKGKRPAGVDRVRDGEEETEEDIFERKNKAVAHVRRRHSTKESVSRRVLKTCAMSGESHQWLHPAERDVSQSDITGH